MSSANPVGGKSVRVCWCVRVYVCYVYVCKVMHQLFGQSQEGNSQYIF